VAPKQAGGGTVTNNGGPALALHGAVTEEIIEHAPLAKGKEPIHRHGLIESASGDAPGRDTSMLCG
jgi:hypothetical protein